MKSEKTMKLKKDDSLVPVRTAGAKAAFAIVFVIFTVYALSIVSAMAWTFLQSLKGSREFFRDMTSLPKEWLFANYGKAFSAIAYERTTLFGMFFNSVWFALGMSLLSVFAHCATGYGFAKYKFKGKEIAFSFVLFTLIVPVVGNLPSMYKVVHTLKLNDTPLYLVTALGGFGGNFLIMYAFFKGIDWAYAEAAQIDGAGHLYIFLRIMLPLAAGPIMALSVVGVIGQWNNYETPILFLGKWPTLASGLYFYKETIRYESNEPVYLAGVLMATVPILAMVAVFGNKIMRNMTMGGIKG